MLILMFFMSIFENKKVRDVVQFDGEEQENPKVTIYTDTVSEDQLLKFIEAMKLGASKFRYPSKLYHKIMNTRGHIIVSSDGKIIYEITVTPRLFDEDDVDPGRVVIYEGELDYPTLLKIIQYFTDHNIRFRVDIKNE